LGPRHQHRAPRLPRQLRPPQPRPLILRPQQKGQPTALRGLCLIGPLKKTTFQLVMALQLLVGAICSTCQQCNTTSRFRSFKKKR
jgi:hypothetical protein